MSNPAVAPFSVEEHDALVERLHRDYTHHPPIDDQVMRYAVIRDGMRQYLERLLTMGVIRQNSREFQLALTHCEQATFYLNAAIARHERIDQ